MRVRSIKHLNRPAAVSVPRSEGDVAPASLSEREAARYIGMSAAWLKKSRTRKFRDTADAPPFVRCGTRRIVYRREDLDRWVVRHLEGVGCQDMERAEQHPRIWSAVTEAARPSVRA